MQQIHIFHFYKVSYLNQFNFLKVNYVEVHIWFLDFSDLNSLVF